MKRQNLSKDKNEQRTDRFALEENIDSTIMSLDNKTRSINLSIKELEIQDEKEALDKYGSSDSGASLGDILGSVLKIELMIKSEILDKLNKKHLNLNPSDIENLFDLFIKKIVKSLKDGKI